MKNNILLAEFVLGIADDRIITGQRLSEWCGRAPVLEEDIALTNMALDCFGQGQQLLAIVGELEGVSKSPDDYAYFRDETEYRNALIVEQPNGNFADSIVRHFFYSVYIELLYRALCTSECRELAEIAAVGLKETSYHVRHTAEWIVRLGDGTEESHGKVSEAVDTLWSYTTELFEPAQAEEVLIADKLLPDLSTLRADWEACLAQVFMRAGLQIPGDEFQHTGGRQGFHTEHLGHLLAEMQILPRSYPSFSW